MPRSSSYHVSCIRLKALQTTELMDRRIFRCHLPEIHLFCVRRAQRSYYVTNLKAKLSCFDPLLWMS